MVPTTQPWSGRLDKRYLYLEPLGSRQPTRSHKAQDTHTGKLVVIHTFRTGLSAPPQIEEIERYRLIFHPHVTACVGEGQLPDGSPYLAMEWVEGINLADWLAAKPRDILEAVDILIQVARGLAEIHLQGLVHRRISPSHILIDSQQNRTKIIGFGFSTANERRSITLDGVQSDVPPYLSPEAVSTEEPQSPAADVYSLCAVLYELACGQRVHNSERLWELIGKIMFESPQAPRQLNPAIGQSLEQLLLKGLKKEARQRFPDGGALVRALLNCKKAGLTENELDQTMPLNSLTESVFIDIWEVRRLVAVLWIPAKKAPSRQTQAALGETIQSFGGMVQGTSEGTVGLFGIERSYGDEITRAVRCGFALAADHMLHSAISMGKMDDQGNPNQALREAKKLIPADPTQGYVYISRGLAARARGAFKLVPEAGRYCITRPLDSREWPTQAGSLWSSETKQLSELLQTCATQKRPYISAIVGEGGMGKTTLTRYLCGRATAMDYQVIAVEAMADIGDRPYGLIAQLIEGFAGAHERLSNLERRDRIQRYLASCESADLLYRHIFQWEASAEPHHRILEIRWELWETLAKLISNDLAKKPQLWAIDDLHRADLVSRAAIQWLTTTLEGSLFITITLPMEALKKERERFKLPVNEIHLNPIEPAVAHKLIKHLAPDMETKQINRIIVEAGGNPLFLKELTLSFQSGGQHHTPSRNIQAMVQALLDRYPYAVVSAAEAASVLGAQGSLGAVAHLARLQHVERIAEILVEAGIWRGQGAVTNAPHSTFRFKHELVRQAVYRLLTPMAKRALHAEAARYFDRNQERHPLQAARHYLDAGQDHKAIRCLQEAAHQTMNAADGETTLRIVQRLEQLPLDEEERRQMHLMRAQASAWMGQLQNALEDVYLILDHPQTSSIERAQTACLGCLILRRLSRVTEGLNLAEVALVEALITLDDELTAKALFHAAFAYYDAGDAKGVRQCLDQALALPEENLWVASVCFEIETLVANLEAHFERSYQACKRTLAINRKLGHVTRLGANTANAGLALIFLGRFAEALPFLREARAIYTRQHNRLQLFDAMINEARILGYLGQYDESIDLLREAYHALNQSQETHFSAVAIALLARFLMARGQEQDCKLAQQIVRKHLDPERYSPIHGLEQAIAIMEVCQQSGQAEQAKEAAEWSLKTLEKSGDDSELASEVLARAAIILRTLRHSRYEEIKQRTLTRIAYLLERCSEGESRQGILQRIWAHRDFIEAVGINPETLQ